MPKTWVQYILLLISLCFFFYLGYLYALREVSANKEANLNIIVPNGYTFNDLERLQIYNVYGLLDGEIKEYGKLFLWPGIKPEAEDAVGSNSNSQEGDDKRDTTQMRLQLDNVPAGFSQTETSPIVKLLPEDLELNFFTLSRDSLNQDPLLENSLKINFAKTEQILNIDYTTTLNISIAKLQSSRMQIRSSSVDSIFINESPELTVSQRNQPSDIFWSEL